MNLDDYPNFAQLDSQNMLAEIDGLPDQLRVAWEMGQGLPLPTKGGIQQVLIAGMGGSAIGADLLAAYLTPDCPLPLVVHRNYGLPGWARGPQTLVIACSHSGDTEETISAFKGAQANGCRLMVICTGGKLAREAAGAGVPAWIFGHTGQPRAAVGYSFGLLLAAAWRLGLAPDPSQELAEAVRAMRAQQEGLRAEVPVVHNPAKRMAGQLVGRWVTIFGADVLEPVARRWKGKINELAKAGAQFDSLPEADHNTVAGVSNPEKVMGEIMALFLRAPSYQEDIQLRVDLTKKILMLEGLNTDFIDAQGEARLAHQWTALHCGDYVAYYLAMAYEVDPTPIPAIEGFKQEMRTARQRRG